MLDRLIAYVQGYTRAEWFQYMSEFSARDWAEWASSYDEEMNDILAWEVEEWEEHYAPFSVSDWVRWIFWEG